MSDQRIDDIEFPEDLARQRADFARSRIAEHLGRTRRAVRSLEDGTYSRADLVSDAFESWGALVRDLSTGWMLGIRSVNRWAEDTPVAQHPHRRVSITVDLAARAEEVPGSVPFDARDRPLSVGATRLVRDLEADDDEEIVIHPGEVEISPNPLLDGDTVITVSVDRSNPGGTYRGNLLLYGLDPGAPRPLAIVVELDGKFDRR